MTYEWKIEKFGLCRRRKTWITASKFDKFCEQKFDKRRMLFCAVSKDYLCIYYSAEFDSFQSSGSQPLFRKLGLWDKCNLPLLKVPNHVVSLDYCASMHELAIGIPLFSF